MDNPFVTKGYAGPGSLFLYQRKVISDHELHEPGIAHISREPDLAMVQHSLAGLFFKVRRNSEAMKLFLSALEIRKRLAANSDKYGSEVASSQGNLAFLLLFMKRYNEAEQYAREGLAVDSTQHWIVGNLAAALLFQGKYAEAEKVYLHYKDELKKDYLDDFKQYAEAGVIPKVCEADVEKIKRILND